MFYIKVGDSAILESEEVASGVICDFDKNGAVVGVEILLLGSQIKIGMQRQKVKLVQKSGNVLGVVEIYEPSTVFLECEAIIWEYHEQPHCFVNTHRRDEETGYLIFEHQDGSVDLVNLISVDFFLGL